MSVLDRAAHRQANGETFALATVVRTVSVTAAKAGAKALINPDGSIEEGWIGGGCARAAVLKAARQSMIDGQSRLVSIAPKDLLADLGVAPGEDRAGVFYAKNSCPSQGTMDIFVEPVLPSPRLLIFGASPVAVELAKLAPQMGFAVTVAAPPGELARFEGPCAKVEGFTPPADLGTQAFVVISTQGAGDRAALAAAAGMDARYRAFIGSRRKAEALRRELAEAGVATAGLAAIKAPAGLDISAITSEEIALSILAEMVAARRHAQLAPPLAAPLSGGPSP
jgi:xanthine dehydrogenase accessory factor